MHDALGWVDASKYNDEVYAVNSDEDLRDDKAMDE